MNAIFRRIDLATSVLIPLVLGQVMTFASLLASTIALCVFNLVATVTEYFLLSNVYKAVPALREKKTKKKYPAKRDPDTQEAATSAPNPAERPLMVDGKDKPGDGGVERKRTNVDRKRLMRVFDSFVTLYKGWRCYSRQSIRLVGLGFACLYLTVLNFHYLTAGYAYSQGMTESLVGIVAALDAGIGFFGTFGFEFMRSRVGLVRTGVISLGWQVSFLTLCVASVWVPGSPFMNLFGTPQSVAMVNCTVAMEPISNQSFPSNQTDIGHTDQTYYPVAVTQTVIPSFSPDSGSLPPVADVFMNETCNNGTKNSRQLSTVHISMLVTGIVASRFGLWSADVTVTQLFLENVKESERGIVNGVQSSINMLMDVVRYAVVIAAPRPETFGFLVLMSFCSVSLGLILYSAYARKALRRTPERGCGDPGVEEVTTDV